MARAIVYAVGATLVPGCVETELRTVPEVGRDYRIDVVENVSVAQFDLRLVALTDRQLCLEVDTWPFEGKLIEAWQGTVFVRSGDERLPMRGPIGRSNDTVRIFVNEAEPIEGSIPFSSFPDLDFSPATPRTLEYQAGVTFCDETLQ